MVTYNDDADVERIFSVTLSQTRNKLKTETLDTLILVKQGLPCNSIEFKPDTAMCKCINAEIMTDSFELLIVIKMFLFLIKTQGYFFMLTWGKIKFWVWRH